MKKILLLFLVVSLSLLANPLKTGDKLESVLNFSDQFDNIHELNTLNNKVIVSFEKGTGKLVNEFLSQKDKNYLTTHNATFIANISGMPSIITKLFALPKMKKYKHTILLIYNEDNTMFPSHEGEITLLSIKNSVVQSIEFIKNEEELKAFIEK
ncbi:MAG: hypothetical protein ACNI3C_10805 [Candidatus Marinarcus sp.]|uniref:hypothetical protein n=1 Tax=Candidatus Marinarcus sp. TaxID=3100987 RepID=UPI003B00A11E